MTEAPTVTLSMFWPLLLQVAENDFNPNAHAAIARLLARPGFDADTLSAEGVAEEMARQHFPSGTTTRTMGFYCGEVWEDAIDIFDTFDEMVHQMAGDGPLVATDPGHVAMVVRMLAISQSLPVYIEGPNVKFKHHDTYLDADDIDSGPGVMISLERTRPARCSAEPVAVGCYLPYLPGESAENLDVGVAVFRWLAERHAEIVKATKAKDEAEPDPANVTELWGA